MARSQFVPPIRELGSALFLNGYVSAPLVKVIFAGLAPDSVSNVLLQSLFPWYIISGFGRPPLCLKMAV